MAEDFTLFADLLAWAVAAAPYVLAACASFVGAFIAVAAKMRRKAYGPGGGRR